MKLTILITAFSLTKLDSVDLVLNLWALTMLLNLALVLQTFSELIVVLLFRKPLKNHARRRKFHRSQKKSMRSAIGRL